MTTPSTAGSTPGITGSVSLASLTTLRIGGPCRGLSVVRSAEDVSFSVDYARKRKWPVVFLGAGSNVLFDDSGFSGLVIQNQLLGVEHQGSTVQVMGGEDLGALIHNLNRRGLSGLERMYGIPGTVAGAVVGNAGAYGQEIAERILDVEVWQEGSVRRLKADELNFSYRHSRFKERPDWFFISCRLCLIPSPDDLQATSEEILATRLKKYPPGLRCPGSYFKNLVLEEIPAESIGRFPPHFVHYGKIPAGVLLEAVGANNRRRGDAWIADYHGNLFVNLGKATARDLRWLAQTYSRAVRRRFGVSLSPEIRIVAGAETANIVYTQGKSSPIGRQANG